MNFSQARKNLIEGQIHTWEVLDPRILDLYHKFPREDFMPPEYSRLALAETPIPLAHNQQTMIPGVEARMLQALDINPGERVLEIGTGCAYVTALLAGLGGIVTSIDLYDDFTVQASKKLERHDLLSRIQLLGGDALSTWPVEGDFDVIAVTGSLPKPRQDWIDRLRPGGRLFVVLGSNPVMHAVLFKRLPAVRYELLFETELPPLVGTEPEYAFRF